MFLTSAYATEDKSTYSVGIFFDNLLFKTIGRDFISKSLSRLQRTQQKYSRYRFRQRVDRALKKSPPWKENKLHITILIIVIISMTIGVINIKITDTISFLLLPLIYSLIMGLVLYLAKPIKFIGPKQAKVAEGVMVLLIGVLLAKLAISSGQSISAIFKVGPALVF